MKQITLAIVSIFLFFGCTSDDDKVAIPENEEEVITTVIVYVTDINNAVFEYTYEVINSAVMVDDINLEPNSFYKISLGFFNANEDPMENITAEIQNEAEDHLICYDASTSLSEALAITITDEDANGKKIGLSSDWNTSASATGEIEIKLKHQPGIKADIEPEDCDAGETDIEVEFPVIIE